MTTNNPKTILFALKRSFSLESKDTSRAPGINNSRSHSNYQLSTVYQGDLKSSGKSANKGRTKKLYPSGVTSVYDHKTRVRNPNRIKWVPPAPLPWKDTNEK